MVSSSCFKDLIKYYPPGSDVIRYEQGADFRLYRVINCVYSKPPEVFTIHYKFAAYNGDMCGWMSEMTMIPSYEGRKSFLSFDVSPFLETAQCDTQIRQRARKRGERHEFFSKCIGHLAEYSGLFTPLPGASAGCAAPRDQQRQSDGLENLGKLSLQNETDKTFLKSLAATEDMRSILSGHPKGLTIFLTGEAGSGKTSTVVNGDYSKFYKTVVPYADKNPVAESMKVCLYTLTVDELDKDILNAEATLKQALELSGRWGAIFLLEGCDEIIKRNHPTLTDIPWLSSVIQRLLNSYHGIAFLVANNQPPRLEFNPDFELLFDRTPRILGLVQQETPF
ncbi:hypothetical protein HYE68_005081 [Fusarium pseudograminearum]|nr:hypothetical protein HYE68_005081 [Fusarium pseudograminearum]